MKPLSLSKPEEERPINPAGIFDRLTLRGPIENIWAPQSDALQRWHAVRKKPHVAIEMSTGGGKTLVGLLVAQSLVNETGGQVLYLCPTNQLVEQTCRRAVEIGLSPATRAKGEWEGKPAFDSGRTFCVTNYHTYFNGRSVFRSSTPSAVVFDDAHVSEHIVRDQFTMSLPKKHDAFGKVLRRLLREKKASPAMERIDDILNGEQTSCVYVPAFVIWETRDELRSILIDSGVARDEKTKFPWEYIKDNLQHCSFVASPKALEISPPCLPLNAAVQLTGAERCVYLTATQPSPLSMCRTFGISDVETVRPKGKSGDAQRLFVFAPGETDVEQRRFALGLVQSEKSCVIAPSKRLAEDWTPEATLFEKEDGQEEIDRFCESPDADMLGLVARYDGIDLPGNACRHLILYHLPIGESLFARFVDETLQVESIRTSRTATRLTQAVGRIFRSNTDHGVVIVVGSDLQGWLRRIANQQYLPQRLQQQLKLASDLEAQIAQGGTSWGELAKALIVADPGWDQTYSSHIDNYGATEAPNPAEWSVELALKEHVAFWDLWSGQAHQASAAFSTMADQAAEHDDRLAAWYSHLSGLCSLQAGNPEEAYVNFLSAANIRAELGRPSTSAGRAFKTGASTVVCQQAKSLAGRYRKKRAQMLKELARVKTDIGLTEQTNRVEEAVKLLGGLLGLDATRPDKEVGKGPDTLWEGYGTPSALGIELKTDKKLDTYSKDEIGQCHNHDQFLRERFGDSFVLALAGGAMRVSPKANPAPELRVFPMTAFVDVYDRTQKLYDAIEGETGAGLEAAFDRWLRHLGLVWPAIANSLESRLAMDLMHE